MNKPRSTLTIEKHEIDGDDTLTVVVNGVKQAANGSLVIRMMNGVLGTIDCDGFKTWPGWTTQGTIGVNPMMGSSGLAFTLQLEISDLELGHYLLAAYSLSIEDMEEIVKRMAAEVELLRFERDNEGG